MGNAYSALTHTGFLKSSHVYRGQKTVLLFKYKMCSYCYKANGIRAPFHIIYKDAALLPSKWHSTSERTFQSQ